MSSFAYAFCEVEGICLKLLVELWGENVCPAPDIGRPFPLPKLVADELPWPCRDAYGIFAVVLCVGVD